jgi:hypothetical protein
MGVNKGIDPRARADRPYSTGNPAKVDFAGGDFDIYQTRPGEEQKFLFNLMSDPGNSSLRKFCYLHVAHQISMHSSQHEYLHTTASRVHAGTKCDPADKVEAETRRNVQHL